MPDEKGAQLRIVGKDPARDATHAASALAAIGAAGSAEEAFHRLRSWSLGPAALSATADIVEEELHRGSREVMRRLLEESIRARGVEAVGSAVELSLTEGVELRLGERREHGRALASLFGPVEVRRLGYGKPGVAAVHPLDESLNLPRRSYSHPVQKRQKKKMATVASVHTTKPHPRTAGRRREDRRDEEHRSSGAQGHVNDPRSALRRQQQRCAAGARGVLFKPTSGAILVETVRRTLRAMQHA